MKAKKIKEWILILSTSITMLSVALGSWLTLSQYRLKLEAEERLARTSQIETNIQMVSALKDLMSDAGGRSGHYFSEQVAEALLSKETFPLGTAEDVDRLNKVIKDGAVIRLPVSIAEGQSALVSVCELAKRHELVRDITIQLLPYFTTFHGAEDIAKTYLQELKSIPKE